MNWCPKKIFKRFGFLHFGLNLFCRKMWWGNEESCIHLWRIFYKESVAIYWTLPPGSFFKGKIEKMKVSDGSFEIWNKQNVARTPVLNLHLPTATICIILKRHIFCTKKRNHIWGGLWRLKNSTHAKINCFNFLSTNFHFHVSVSFQAGIVE